MYKDWEELCRAYDRGVKIKYLFFWGHTSGNRDSAGTDCLSQWYPAQFVANGIKYFTAEQWMMAEIARLFGDKEILKKILDDSLKIKDR